MRGGETVFFIRESAGQHRVELKGRASFVQQVVVVRGAKVDVLFSDQASQSFSVACGSCSGRPEWFVEVGEFTGLG